MKNLSQNDCNCPLRTHFIIQLITATLFWGTCETSWENFKYTYIVMLTLQMEQNFTKSYNLPAKPNKALV